MQFNIKLSTIFIIVHLVISGFATAQFYAVSVPDTPDETFSTTNRIDFGNGYFVDVEVLDNITSLTFNDGSKIKVNASEHLTIIEIWNSSDSSHMVRLTYSSSNQFFPAPQEFTQIEGLPTPSLKLEKINSDTNTIETEMLAMSLTSSDPIPIHGFGVKGYTTDPSSPTAPPQFFEFVHASNISNSAGRLYFGNDPADPTDFTQVDYLQDNRYSDFGPLSMNLRDKNANSDVNVSLNVGRNDIGNGVDSFFDVFTELSLPDGRNQDHTFSGGILGNSGGSFFNYLNQTDGYANSSTTEPGTQPQASRLPFPGFDDPTIPFQFLDLLLSPESIIVTFGYLSLALYVDKVVINYFSPSGYYIPIVIYTIIQQVHIVIEYVTVIVYMQVVELITVIVIYEVIKIEVYIEYVIIVIEIIEITIIEITIWYINIDIIILINIIVNVFIFTIKIIVNIIKLIFILPILIWIVFVPVPFPVFIPIFIPVPTPVPIPLPNVEVSINSQNFNEVGGTMNLSYSVTDEYNNPISGANVTVSITDQTGVTKSYTAVESTSQQGVYITGSIPIELNANIVVTADTMSYRPIGQLSYSQSHTDASAAPNNVTVTTTVQPSGNNTNSPLPVQSSSLIIAMILLTGMMMVTRRKERREI